MLVGYKLHLAEILTIRLGCTHGLPQYTCHFDKLLNYVCRLVLMLHLAG